MSDEREREKAYEKIDRYLRANLYDADYSEYSEAMELLWECPTAAPAVTAPPADVMRLALEAPGDLRIVSKNTCIAVMDGNDVLGSFVGPDSQRNAELFIAALRAAIATPQQEKPK